MIFSKYQGAFVLGVGLTIFSISMYKFLKCRIQTKCCENELRLKSDSINNHHINLMISKEKPIVVDTIKLEEIKEDKAFCRCWMSKLFPYCDGAHRKHNAETGDNVGPLLIKK